MYINYHNIYCRRDVSQSENFDDLCGFCLGFNEELVIADPIYNRIKTFDKAGTRIWQFGSRGTLVDMLCYAKIHRSTPFLHS